MRTLSSSTSHSPSRVAHDVEAGDADPDAVARAHARHRGLEVLGAVEHALRQHALGDDPALRVDVGDERVERAARAARGRPRRAPTRRLGITRGTGSTCQVSSPSTDAEADAERRDLVAHARGERREVVREHRVHDRARGRPDAPVRGHGVVDVAER